MEDMLRGITAGSAAASNPLLRSLLGPGASQTDYLQLAQEAEGLWKMMDEMAESDPQAYQDFITGTAKAAREEAEKGRDQHVEGLVPALVLEVQAQQQQQRGGGGSGSGEQPGGGRQAAVDVTRVVAGGQAVARVHVWAANDASGLTPPSLFGGVPLLRAPAPPSSWLGLQVPLAEYRPALTQPGQLPLHHFHLACHAATARMALADQPPGFRGALLEALSQFVEASYGLHLSRSLRTLAVHREAVEGEPQLLGELVRRQEEEEERGKERERVAAGGREGVVGGEEEVGGESELPRGLLEELRTLGTSGARKKEQQQSCGSSAAGGGEGGKVRKPLIQELD
ncbi:hypothetical protein Agub_g788 [Astrephomene gubernaculifera]|uniref:Uncharacterized protein n=1 Tax=Astrephomene gubernaculifera TaxID=47775 RepID=A0AAD3HGZ1_9CHLO|nr:hypothetical protein Agub_g788 [Astrephomene gubernaculifera]